MAKVKKSNGRKAYFICLTVYVVLLIAASCFGLSVVWQYAKEYENSVSMPKMIETSNFWVQLETTFSQVWNGADANQMLKKLSEQIMQQVTGQPYEEEYIEENREEEEVEYLDEDYYTQEALEE